MLLTTWFTPLCSIPETCPLLEFKSPIISPIYSSGVTTSTFIIGSRRTALAFGIASLKAALEAISNAITLESTSWNAPSTRVHLKSITGNPARKPVSVDDLIPFSTPGIYSRGTRPPTILLSKTTPLPLSRGSNSKTTLANWPAPPDCFLWV